MGHLHAFHMSRTEIIVLILIGLFICIAYPYAYSGEDFFPEDGNWVGKPKKIVCHRYADNAVQDLKTMRRYPDFRSNNNDQWLEGKLAEWKENGLPTRDFEALVFANCMGGKEACNSFGFVLVGSQQPPVAEPDAEVQTAKPARPDYVEALKSAGRVAYCGELANRWDDGTWARAMGIADLILIPQVGEPRQWPNPDEMPRDGIRHQSWVEMNDNERAWYAILFHAGWKAADAWIAGHASEVIADPHDFTGVIPYLSRMEMKQKRFEKCLHEWKPP